MFSYYGSKSKIAHFYPAPKYGRIIEPFAGSARYSLLHFENEVFLYDTNPVVVGVWKYLLEASPKDILGLPDAPSKVHIDEFAPSITQPERDLIGFHLCRGKARPRKTGHGQNGWNRDKVRIAENLYKIKHWKIKNWDAFGLTVWLQTKKATWFIDPPYKEAMERKGNGDRYPHWQMDYSKLAEFVQSRPGLAIACEGDGADYLPFEKLVTVNGNTNNRTVKKNAEYVYIQDDSK